MAKILFYDASDIDKQQLGKLLAETDHQVVFVEEPLSLDNADPEAEVISGFITSVVNEKHMDAMPKLKLISCRSTGTNHVDIAAAQARGITVTYVPSYGDHTVAEHAFMLLLALSRKLMPTVKAVDELDIDPLKLIGFDLNEKVFGLIGAGRIGQVAARIAVGFGMKVVAYDPYPNEEKAREIGFTFADKETVLAQADVVSLHMPFTGDNLHFIDAPEFAMMKDGVVVINTARGQLLNQGALIDALKSGKVSAAGLDVFEGENLLDADEDIQLLAHPRAKAAHDSLVQDVQLTVLHSMPNVIITPHNAFNTMEARYRINETTAFNVTRYWYGETPNEFKQR